jgi:hypothetical protein
MPGVNGSTVGVGAEALASARARRVGLGLNPVFRRPCFFPFGITIGVIELLLGFLKWTRRPSCLNGGPISLESFGEPRMSDGDPPNLFELAWTLRFQAKEIASALESYRYS